MHKIKIIFERVEEDKFLIAIKSEYIIFEFDTKIHPMFIGDTCTLTLDIPETINEILEAKICRSAMS